jgi:DNA polymerase III delta subunit
MAKKTGSSSSRSRGGKDNTPARPLSAECRVVLLHGSELFLRAQYTQQLREQLSQAFSGLDVFQFDGEKDEAAAILDECRSFGLMSAHKLVIVDNADQFVKEANRAIVERYVQAPCEGATLLLRAGKWNRGKLDAMIERVGAITRCDEITPDQAMRWLRGYTRKRLDAEMDERAAGLMVERFGCDLGRLASESAKLAVAAGAGGRITPAMIDELATGTREIDLWRTLPEVLLSGDAESRIAGLREIAASASKEVHVPLAISAASFAAALYAIAGAKGDKGLTPRVAQSRKIWGDRIAPAQSAARRADPEALRALLNHALDTDAKGKSGVGNPEISLEVLAWRFAQTLR